MLTADRQQPPPEDEVPFLSEDSSPPIATSDQASPNVSRPQFDITDDREQNRKQSDIKRRLYLSHFLSTWNSRVFEFGAVLILAHIYENTLLPASLYALIRAASAICLSPTVGYYVDREDRLKVVRRSIIGQRLAVILSIPGFWLLGIGSLIGGILNGVLFSIMAALACIEKLCSIMNLVAIERDWVVVIAENSQCELEVLNAQMRRIDLTCKLLGPLVIALVDARSLLLALEVIFGMNVLSFLIEYFAIADVYRMIPALSSRKDSLAGRTDTVHTSQDTRLYRNIPALCLDQARGIYQRLSNYSYHPAFLPSFALCLLYLTVLSFSGQMVTYLLSVGLTSTQIGLLRTLSTAVEISATWLAPMALNRVGLLRSGLWFVNWQIACLLGAVISFLLIEKSTLAALILVAGVIASRVGLWGFDLCVQIIVQEVGPLIRRCTSGWTDINGRKWRLIQEGPFLPWKHLFKISSSSAHLPRPSSSLVLINSGTPSRSAL